MGFGLGVAALAATTVASRAAFVHASWGAFAPACYDIFSDRPCESAWLSGAFSFTSFASATGLVAMSAASGWAFTPVRSNARPRPFIISGSVLVGAGVATLAATRPYYGSFHLTHERLPKSGCADDRTCFFAGQEISFAVGVGALAAGSALLTTGLVRRRRERAALELTVVPMATPSMQGLSCSGRF